VDLRQARRFDQVRARTTDAASGMRVAISGRMELTRFEQTLVAFLFLPLALSAVLFAFA